MKLRFAAIVTFSLRGLILFWVSTLFADDRSNIVLLLADDLGFSDLGSYGSEISTPNLDELARRGVRFSNYHTAASCAPTRAMLMSGVDSHRAGVANMPESIPPDQRGHAGYEGTLSKNVVTVATRLRDAGYHTYMTGKWHLGKTPELLPSARGFERTLAMADTGSDNWEQKPYLPIYSKANWFEDGAETRLPDDFYSSAYFVDKTIEYIDSNIADGKPFFAYVAFQAVHLPVQAPREYTNKYLGQYDDGWAELRKRRYEGAVDAGVVKDGIEMAVMPTTKDWSALTEDQQRYQSKRMAVYAGMIDAMDFHIGRLVSYLKANGEYENTIIIFASDNGAEPSDVFHTGQALVDFFFPLWMFTNNYNTDYETLGEKGSYSLIGPSFASSAASPFAWYKFFSGEGGMRVPLLIAGMGSPNDGGVVDAFTWVTDIVPTILDIAGVKNSDGVYQGRQVEQLTGRSLLPLLDGSSINVYADDEPVGYELGGNAALFKGAYKLTKNRGPIADGQWHLYQMNDDPGETRDLKKIEPVIFQTMMQDYERYVRENEVLPVGENYDQRKQVFYYGLQKRLGAVLPFLAGFLVLVVFLVIWRRSRATIQT
ncbi:MAG: arylsulfatase [Gammaproteobacteria bacterium]|nr:arylsulfatase [Gammaproteobacteria bacterium]